MRTHIEPKSIIINGRKYFFIEHKVAGYYQTDFYTKTDKIILKRVPFLWGPVVQQIEYKYIFTYHDWLTGGFSEKRLKEVEKDMFEKDTQIQKLNKGELSI